MQTIDLNADVGEGAGNDAELIPLVTSANIACGGHAGDAQTMEATARLAIAHGVAIGAHPGHEDRAYFGRRELVVTPDGVAELVRRQLAGLRAIVQTCGGEVAYVKLHGALYHQAGRDEALATAVVEATEGLPLLGQAGSQLHKAAQREGVPHFAEAFADRAYLVSGALAPRSREGSLLSSESAVVEQAVRLARDGRTTTPAGEPVVAPCESLCLHGDGPGVVSLAQAIRAALAAASIATRPFTSASRA